MLTRHLRCTRRTAGYWTTGPEPWVDRDGLEHHRVGHAYSADGGLCVYTACGRVLPQPDTTPTDTEPCEVCTRDRQ